MDDLSTPSKLGLITVGIYLLLSVILQLVGLKRIARHPKFIVVSFFIVFMFVLAASISR